MDVKHELTFYLTQKDLKNILADYFGFKRNQVSYFYSAEPLAAMITFKKETKENDR